MRRAGATPAIVAVTVAAALAVAAFIARKLPDFARLPVAATLGDARGDPVWTLRIAAAAHELSASALRSEPASVGDVFQLWLLSGGAPHSLGLLPASGEARLPVLPSVARLFDRGGELIVTAEPIGLAPASRPTGAAAFRAVLTNPR